MIEIFTKKLRHYRQTEPGTVFGSNAITRWEREGEKMTKTARSYYNKSRYIEKRTRKGRGIDHFQFGVGLLHVRKVEIMENLLFETELI